MAVTTTQYITTGKYQYPTAGSTIVHTIDLTAATVTTGGAVASLANPLGVDLIITRALVNVTTKATGVATIDVGVGATATTSNDGLLDGLDVGTAAGLFDNLNATNAGTNGKSSKTWSASQFVTATASATLAGLVGTLTLICVRA